MRYKMEELLPIVARLSEKYTGFESTSITYEKAEQLMGAVIYCIQESGKSIEQSNYDLVAQLNLMSAEKAYEIGYGKVTEKVKASMDVYHRMLPYFDDYGNRCLSDTVLKGIPEFFKWYDVKFNPQDTILTLDYPVLMDMTRYQGVDAIYIYLKCIEKEQKYLSRFNRLEIQAVLAAYNSEYEDMIDNVYRAVYQYYEKK